jgi:predicted kinase
MKLYLFRGVPGSGKSTFALKNGGPVFEADQYHFEDGEYKFDFDNLNQAHKTCQWMTEKAMGLKYRSINVSNTFIKRKELKPYLVLAEKYGYEVIINRVEGDWGNVHDVPKETLIRMEENIQPIEGENIIRNYKDDGRST